MANGMTFDMSLAIQTLAAQGEVIHQLHVAALSPYVNRHIKRYGDYVVNLGVETQRQWSDLAIAQTTPLLFGLFSLVTYCLCTSFTT
ncbi:MAG: hypothetical protein RMY34_29535 [Aulosira sp. DedQUE10]|nr:hypothetical protein [Aulosira sp. DedQUE10]